MAGNKKYTSIISNGEEDFYIRDPEALKTSVVRDTTSGAKTIASAAVNTVYSYGTISGLTVTALAAPTNTAVPAEYVFEFTLGSTVGTMSFPASVVWVDGVPDWQANKHYRVVILCNAGDGNYYAAYKVVDGKEIIKDGGNYPDLTAGNIVGQFRQNDAEFAYRPSAGSVDIKSGYKVDHGGKILGIKGNTVAWNQLIQNPLFENGANEWGEYEVTSSASDGVMSVTASRNGDNFLSQDVSLVGGHKYYCLLSVKADSTNVNTIVLYLFYGSASDYLTCSVEDTNWNSIKRMFTAVSGNINSFRLQVTRIGTNQYKKPQLIDLTLIYGAGNEPNTAAEFEEDYFRWFGKPLTYEAYDEGSLRSVKMTGMKTVGFNQWDEEWRNGYYNINGEFSADSDYVANANPIPVLPNTVYSFVNKTGRVCWYDKKMQFISTETVYNQDTKTSPENAHYLNFDMLPAYGTTYNHDICINLHHSGSRDGEYEEHWESVANLDVTKVYGKLNGEGSLVQVFPDGMKKADYAGTIRDLLCLKGRTADVYVGKQVISENGLIYVNDYNNVSYISFPKSYGSYDVKGICDKYPYHVNPSYWDTEENVSFLFSNASFNNWWIGFPKGTTSQQMYDSVVGIEIFYELATPLHYTDCVYRDNGVDIPLDQIGEYDVDDCGTEEITAPTGVASIAPVLDLEYGINAADTLKNLPKKYLSTGAQTLTQEQKTRVRRNLGLDSPSGVGMEQTVTGITADTSVSIPAGDWHYYHIIYRNDDSSSHIVTVPTTSVVTPDGQPIELSCPAGGYCEVSLMKVSGTIYARGI